ncbi:glycosyltransferase [Streptomyces indicus]|uniref:Glycosyl transferases group 1 n=1 Tax=Streptomyces indicus TaxID=417292 RepID=A0A1G9CHW6_9ACTN|nr:glycosyltransferase [Streptomyces indicus]SDK51186.1 Glycosyl transferases group 1 [Streptomyces indicus]
MTARTTRMTRMTRMTTRTSRTTAPATSRATAPAPAPAPDHRAEPPLVLQLSNEARDHGPDNRFVPAFAELAAEGLLRHRYLAPAVTPPDLRALAREEPPALLMVQSPQARTWSERQVRELLGALGGPPVLVWEGDAWGGPLKQPRRSNLAWMRRATVVSSVAAGEQQAMLRRAAGVPVHYSPHAAALRFHADEDDPGPVSSQVTFLGTRRTFCGVELLPDDRERLDLVRRLARMDGCDLAVYGRSWSGSYARGPVPFHEQLAVMRRGLLTAGWDRYRSHTGYASDRLAIALCAGRVHVTSRQPGLEWLPGPEEGLYLADTPREAAELVRELLREDPAELLARGARGRAWVRAHLTETHVLRHLLAPHLGFTAPPAAWHTPALGSTR